MTEDTQAPALSAKGVSKRFGGVLAVDDIDLEVGHGEHLALLGPNGAGKTTLFNLVAGVEAPTTGRIHLLGHDVTELPPHRRAHLGLARTFQISQLFDGLSVDDNVYLALSGRPGSIRRLRQADTDSERRGRCAQLITQVGLAERRHDPVSQLSHGEQRQLELAMALAMNPRILLLDEPAAGLSPDERHDLVRLLTELDPAITLVLIEHDMEVALVVGRRVVVMHDGRKLAEGSPEEIQGSELVRHIYLGAGSETSESADG